MKAINLILFISLFLLSSCSGYSFKKRGNPFAAYGVNHISVPMFINRTVIPGVSGPMTSEIMETLSAFPGIRITAGNHSEADAVLIGVLDSSKYRNETYKTASETFLRGELAESLGTRQSFYVPLSTRYNLSLSIMLIRRPTKEEMKLATGNLREFIKNNSKVVFNESFPISSTFTRVIEPNSGPDDGGVVNYTRNKEIFRKNYQDLAESTANSFREVVLNAF